MTETDIISSIDFDKLKPGNVLEAVKLKIGPNGQSIEIPAMLTIVRWLDVEEPDEFRRLLLDVEGKDMFVAPVSEVLMGHFSGWTFHSVLTPEELKG